MLEKVVVLAEGLAMVGNHDHHGVVEPAEPAHGVEQRRERTVGAENPGGVARDVEGQLRGPFGKHGPGPDAAEVGTHDLLAVGVVARHVEIEGLGRLVNTIVGDAWFGR